MLDFYQGKNIAKVIQDMWHGNLMLFPLKELQPLQRVQLVYLLCTYKIISNFLQVLISSSHIFRFLGIYRYAIATKKSCSYILQLAISLGQLYGTAVYFVTAILDGDNFATSPFYYYWYYVFANMWWVIIPTTIVVRCWRKICAACQVQEQRKTKTR